MVKSENDTDLKALASEMKILIYLGSHLLNVVNLLGACTKKVHRGIRKNLVVFISRFEYYFFTCL